MGRASVFRASRWLAVMAGTVLGASAAGTAGHAAPLAEIIKRHELVVCAYANALPFSRQGGAPAGFQIDLGESLAAGLGVALRVHFMRLHREPRRRECDALISVAVPKSPDADTDYRVSDPYMAYRSVLVVRKEEAPVRSLADLARGPVAVQSGSWAHYQFTQHGIKVWVRFRTDEDIIQAVENGDAHAGVVSNFGYEWYVHGHPQAAVRAATEFGFDPDFGYDVAVGLMEADAALLERVNAALAQMRENGTISQVLSRYGITALPPGDGAR